MNLNHFTCTLKLNYKNLSYTSYTFIYIFDSSIIDRVIKQEVRWEPFLLRLSCVHQRFLMDSLRRKLSYIYSALVQPKQNKNSSHVTTTIYENIWDIYMYIIYKATKFIHISNCINLWLRNFSNIVMTKVRFFIIFNSENIFFFPIYIIVSYHVITCFSKCVNICQEIPVCPVSANNPNKHILVPVC